MSDLIQKAPRSAERIAALLYVQSWYLIKVAIRLLKTSMLGRM